MSIEKAITAGLAGEKLSRTIIGTSEVSVGHSAVATIDHITGPVLGDPVLGIPYSMPMLIAGSIGNIVGRAAALISISLFD